MTVTIWIIVSILALLVSLALLALIESFRQIEQIRQAIHLGEKPIELDIARAERTSTSIGLPGEVGLEKGSVVVVLSTKCATCAKIADAFSIERPPSTWFVLPSSAAHDPQFKALAGSNRTILDDGHIPGRLGLEVVPSVLLFRQSVLIAAYAVSTVRQLRSLIEEHGDQQRFGKWEANSVIVSSSDGKR